MPAGSTLDPTVAVAMDVCHVDLHRCSMQTSGFGREEPESKFPRALDEASSLGYLDRLDKLARASLRLSRRVSMLNVREWTRRSIRS